MISITVLYIALYCLKTKFNSDIILKVETVSWFFLINVLHKSIFFFIRASFYTTTQWKTVPLIDKECTLMNTTMPYIMQKPSCMKYSCNVLLFLKKIKKIKLMVNAGWFLQYLARAWDFFFFLVSDFRFPLSPHKLYFNFYPILLNNQVNNFNLYYNIFCLLLCIWQPTVCNLLEFVVL